MKESWNTQALPEPNRRMITLMRAFAILSIVSAHCTSSPANASASTKFASCFMQGFGQLGVAVFFYISGALFARNKKSFGNFWKGKIQSLFIPWFVCATLVYLYVALRKRTLSLCGALLSVVGYSSSYWYLATLVLLYLIVFRFCNNRKAMLILIGMSLLYRIPLGLGLVPHNNFTYYINPLNWLWVFGAGVLATNSGWIAEPIKEGSRYRVIACILSVSLVSVWLTANAGNGVVYGYSNLKYVPLSAAAVVAAISSARLLCVKQSGIVTVFHSLGEKSFSIYLLHELGVAGAVAAVCQKIDSPFFVIIRPALVIAVTCLFLNLAGCISKRIGMYAIYTMCTGQRRGK